MNIIPISDSDFDLVELKEFNGKMYPHCKKHGAMNKVSVFENGGGYWRCVSSVAIGKENCCRAGCQQVIAP